MGHALSEPNHPQIVFTPSGRRGRVSPGTTVLDAARTLGVDIDSICGGRGICGRCQVEISAGTFAGVDTDESHLSPIGSTEESYADRKDLAETRRLSCAATVLGDVAIEVPAMSRVHKQVVRKEAHVEALHVDPAVRLYYVELPEPFLGATIGDRERLLVAVQAEWGLSPLSLDPHVLRELYRAIADGEDTLTVAIHDEAQVTAVWPGFHELAYGVAFDVGSTTVAGHLADLSTGEILASAGTMNPQIRFGEDLMSRVSYVMMNPGGAHELTRAIREALNELIEELCARAGVESSDVLELTLVGNPIMHHLVLGIDPTPLGTAPFTLATTESIRLPAVELDLGVNAGARVYVLPCIAGHVGADTAACILAEGPHRGKHVQLLVDVGTNAEIVLGNSHRLLAASSPTGPAFEGAQISSGQRAAPGAIERARVDPETLEARVKVIGSDLWSNEDGFAESISTTGVTGICGSGVIEAVVELYLAGVLSAAGVIEARPGNDRIIADGRTFAYVLMDEPRLLVTQNDVRAIQLAKAALRAGVQLLMDRLSITQVDEIRLAGAFGSHIDVQYAMTLGLIPDCDLDSVRSAGNAAGVGALMALLSVEERAEVERVIRPVEKVETAIEKRFQEHFVEAMAIPHTSDRYPNLRRVVKLPTTPDATRSGSRRRRRTGASREDP
jgi:uncharacterized 2Fe-2S/4Fe-4S cluster protein (DUF4445 family)